MRALDERKQGYASSACRLTEDGHIIRIAAKCRNVVVYPLQRHHLVHQSQVLSIGVVGSVGQVRQVEEAEDAQSILDGNKNDFWIFLYEIVALILRFNRSTHFVSSTVNPYHDWLRGGRRAFSLPDVQAQAVLALNVKGGLFAGFLPLIGTFRIIISLVHTLICNIVHWRLPAQFAHGLLAHERDSLVSNDAS